MGAGAIVPTVIKGVGGIVGGGYNIYEGLRNADRASSWEKKQASSLNALTQLSKQQWDNYKTLYAPNIKKAISETAKSPDYQGAEDAAAVAATRQAIPVYAATTAGSLARGIGSASGATTAAVRDAATRAAIGQAAGRIDARNAASNTAFNNRLGIVTTGRGMPGEVMQGYGTLAGSTGNLASMYGSLAGQNFATAAKFMGIGNWTGGS